MKIQELRDLIEDAYFEILQEQAILKPASQEILGKFPTLKRTLVDLLTVEFTEFVGDIKWVAPKPSTFEIVLQNGESFFLRWTGDGFSAQISGKNYELQTVSQFQQALLRVNDLLKTGPIRTVSDMEAEEEGTDFEGDFSDDFGGGDFDTAEFPEQEFEEPVEEPDFDL